MILNPKTTGPAAAQTWNALDADLQTSLLNNSVLLRTAGAGGFTGSGILFYATSKAAYVLTAKHNLYVQAGHAADYMQYKPSDFIAGFQAAVQVGYGPTGLGQEPATLAPIAGISTYGGDDDWTYDVIVLGFTDAAFITFVQQNALIKNQAAAQNVMNQLKVKNDVRPALDKTKWGYVQTGYGAGSDPDVVLTKGWPDRSRLFQCRFPDPMAQQTGTAYNLDLTAPKTWPTCPPLSDVLLLTARDDNSTGEGDSGGGVFALNPRANPTSAIPIALSLGINCFMTQTPADNPTDAHIENGASTCIYATLAYFINKIPQ